MYKRQELHTFDHWKKEGKSVKKGETHLIECYPVSYTHLDVYKRQVPASLFDALPEWAECRDLVQPGAPYAAPAFILEVYKRQAWQATIVAALAHRPSIWAVTVAALRSS